MGSKQFLFATVHISFHYVGLGFFFFFLLLCLGGKLRLRKKVYILIDVKSQKSQGLGFKSKLPGTRYLYCGSFFGRGGNLSLAETALSSTSLPLLYSKWAGSPAQCAGRNNAAHSGPIYNAAEQP